MIVQSTVTKSSWVGNILLLLCLHLKHILFATAAIQAIPYVNGPLHDMRFAIQGLWNHGL